MEFLKVLWTQTTEYLLIKIPSTFSGPDELSEYVAAVHTAALEKAGPKAKLVIHCSGGLGRSGTFLTIYYLYR